MIYLLTLIKRFFMVNIRYMLLVLSLVFFVGCSTKYQPQGFSGGFSETQLSPNAFNISFRGNGFTSREKASDFALLRSAELALNNGYQYFIITTSDKYVNNSTYTTPTHYNTTFNASTYGNQTYGSAYTTSTGGQTYNIRKPSVDNTIICFKDKPNINGMVYDANFLVKSLKTKYEIE